LSRVYELFGIEVGTGRYQIDTRFKSQHNFRIIGDICCPGIKGINAAAGEHKKANA
jgi:hypothetical protein